MSANRISTQLAKQIERFSIGSYFKLDGNKDGTLWHVTDVGTRVVVAIKHRPGWMSGPPYAVVETVFDENDQVVMVPCMEPVLVSADGADTKEDA